MRGGSGDASGDSWALGVYVRAARIDRGFSIREAARRTGMSTSTWSSIETGTRLDRDTKQHKPAVPDSGNITAAANLLGLSVPQALRMAGYDADLRDPAAVPRPGISQRALAELVSQLSEESRYHLEWVARTMLRGELQAAADGDAPEDDPVLYEHVTWYTEEAEPPAHEPTAQEREPHPNQRADR